MKNYTITNTATNWTKLNMTQLEVSQFVFSKLSKNKFDRTVLIDYNILIQDTNTVLPLSNYTL